MITIHFILSNIGALNGRWDYGILNEFGQERQNREGIDVIENIRELYDGRTFIRLRNALVSLHS